MRGAAKANSSIGGKLYDTANNWTTLSYVWKNSSGDQLVGTWDAPQQQLQWWMGKRLLQTTVTEVPADPLAGQPNITTFYPRREDAIKKALDQVVAAAPGSQDSPEGPEGDPVSGRDRLAAGCDWSGEKGELDKEQRGYVNRACQH
jgi:hypothetical protein